MVSNVEETFPTKIIILILSLPFHIYIFWKELKQSFQEIYRVISIILLYRLFLAEKKKLSII